jgi:hypothetical protein
MSRLSESALLASAESPSVLLVTTAELEEPLVMACAQPAIIQSRLATMGIPIQAIKDFGIGYCLDGLLRGRMCIPIHDESDHLTAYVGYSVHEDDPLVGERYQATSNYRQLRILFNLNRVERGSAYVVVVNGVWSVIRLHSLGVPVVGLLDSPVVAAVVKLLALRGITSVALLCDAEDKHQRSSLLEEFSDAFFVYAPRLGGGARVTTLDDRYLRRLATKPADW